MDLIAAADENWAIGKKGGLLFQAVPDMRRFQEKTVGGLVIMGRKTLESLPGGKPLPQRLNIVLTRNPERVEKKLPDGEQQNLLICKDLPELWLCLRKLNYPDEKIWVAGGAEIYRLLLPYCSSAWITRFLVKAEDVDCWMENIEEARDWALAERGQLQEWKGLRFRFDLYRNTGPR